MSSMAYRQINLLTLQIIGLYTSTHRLCIRLIKYDALSFIR